MINTNNHDGLITETVNIKGAIIPLDKYALDKSRMNNEKEKQTGDRK